MRGVKIERVGNQTLILGDNKLGIDYMLQEGIKVDKVITSPPYNIIRPNSTDRGYGLYKDGMTNEDYISWIVELFNKLDLIVNPNGAIIMNLSYGNENPNAMSLLVADIIKKTAFGLSDILVWKKHSATPNNVSHNKMTRIVEFVYVFCRDSEYKTFTSNKKQIGAREDTSQPIYENLFNFFTAPNNDYSTDLNKATYSSDFVQQIIDRYVLKEDIVLDIFNGTGTTSFACEQNNIKSYGIELSEKQFEHSLKRLNEVQIKLSL